MIHGNSEIQERRKVHIMQMERDVNVGAMVSQSRKRDFRIRCIENGTNMSTVVRDAIDAWMRDHPAKATKKDVFK
jgi:hypothetical protein